MMLLRNVCPVNAVTRLKKSGGGGRRKYLTWNNYKELYNLLKTGYRMEKPDTYYDTLEVKLILKILI